MPHSLRRGRPPLHKPEKDLGTPELQARRQRGLTLEPLDFCLKHGIISHDEHWAGLHLRWLYTLRFGAPTVRGVEFDKLAAAARSHVEHDDHWKAAREWEYNAAVDALAGCGAKRIVLDVCVFHRFPYFLEVAATLPRAKDALPALRAALRKGSADFQEWEKFREGMKLLAKQWDR